MDRGCPEPAGEEGETGIQGNFIGKGEKSRARDVPTTPRVTEPGEENLSWSWERAAPPRAAPKKPI